MLVELKGVGKQFGRGRGVTAVRDVTLSVAAGEVCAIAGPNGAGKSTLLALLLGFLRPTTGEVLLDGDVPRAFHRGGGVAYLPERFTLPHAWTVRQALRGLAVLDRAATARADAVIERLGLTAEAERGIGTLSRGTLQRVGIAQAWLSTARLLVLDEPTEGLDPLWRLRLRELIAEQRAAGTCVVVASHDLAEIERVADRVVLLERGVVRDIVAARPAAGAGDYRLRVLGGADLVMAAFAGARAEAEGSFIVTVGDAGELNARLAAFLASGGVLGAVEPLTLEDRIRPTYEGGA